MDGKNALANRPEETTATFSSPLGYPPPLVGSAALSFFLIPPVFRAHPPQIVSRAPWGQVSVFLSWTICVAQGRFPIPSGDAWGRFLDVPAFFFSSLQPPVCSFFFRRRQLTLRALPPSPIQGPRRGYDFHDSAGAMYGFPDAYWVRDSSGQAAAKQNLLPARRPPSPPLSTILNFSPRVSARASEGSRTPGRETPPGSPNWPRLIGSRYPSLSLPISPLLFGLGRIPRFSTLARIDDATP